jgi:hypothetical protein
MRDSGVKQDIHFGLLGRHWRCGLELRGGLLRAANLHVASIPGKRAVVTDRRDTDMSLIFDLSGGPGMWDPMPLTPPVKPPEQQPPPIWSTPAPQTPAAPEPPKAEPAAAPAPKAPKRAAPAKKARKPAAKKPAKKAAKKKPARKAAKKSAKRTTKKGRRR